MKHHLTIPILFCLLPLAARSQTDEGRMLLGRVVETVSGTTKGVANVHVKIPGFSYTITDDKGSFEIAFPPDKDYVTVIVEDSPGKMIAPPSGLVVVPPSGHLEIVLCSQQNKKLLQQVDALDIRIKKLEKEKKLSQRQLMEMHRTLLDTIIHFENTIARMEQAAQETRESHDAEIRAKDAQIKVLRDSITMLVSALSEALEKRFLKQQAYYDQVSADLLEYADRVKDLRDRLMPRRLPNYFKSNGAIAELDRTTNAYNEMRETILRNYKGNILGVRQYWNNPEAAEQLEDTYDYLLKTVHESNVLPVHRKVIDPIQSYAGGQVGRTSAQKDSKNAAEENLPALSAAILELDKKIQRAISALSNNI